jgi:hypothetical protein
MFLIIFWFINLINCLYKKIFYKKKIIKIKILKMLKIGSYAYCIDITGVHLVKTFKVLGAGSTNNIILGTMVMIVVKSVKMQYFFNNIVKKFIYKIKKRN